jgi:hypothetical protein
MLVVPGQKLLNISKIKSGNVSKDGEKLLSMAGKEILIKAMAQAIPTYAMACFDLTKSFCGQVKSMISRY